MEGRRFCRGKKLGGGVYDSGNDRPVRIFDLSLARYYQAHFTLQLHVIKVGVRRRKL